MPFIQPKFTVKFYVKYRSGRMAVERCANNSAAISAMQASLQAMQANGSVHSFSKKVVEA